MTDLRREFAPITAQAWKAIDDEAQATLRLTLAGRKLVDFVGPLGWAHSAVGLGRTTPLSNGPNDGVEANLRKVQPLAELRASFELARSELEAIGRGARDADLQPVVDAARAIAIGEDRALFHGFPEAGITGICEAAADEALPIPAAFEDYPDVVAQALARLRSSGIAGPYAIALGPRCFTGLAQTTCGGFPVLQHVQELLDGPVVWAPAVDGAVVVSQRGGDFELVVGRDLSIGYRDHSSTAIGFYLEESMTFRVLAPEAAIPLVYGGNKTRRSGS